MEKIKVPIGKPFAGVVVLKVDDSPIPMSNWRLLIKHLCCDKVCWISRARLLERKRRGINRCSQCAKEQIRNERDAEREKKLTESAAPTGVYISGFGFYPFIS